LIFSGGERWGNEGREMKDIYSNYTGDELWVIKETGFVRELQSIREAQFALGNGYLGVRGVYEEIPYDCTPGTYIAGVYDKMAAQVSELVNLPNPVNFKFAVGGEKLDVVAMDVVDHKRALNMKKGVLARYTLYKDSKNRCYEYQSVRFVSQHDKNIGVMQISLTSLDAECVIDINTGLDTSISNAGVLSEGRKKHFRVKELGRQGEAGYLIASTFEKKYTIAYCAGFYYQAGSSKRISAEDNVFRLKLKKKRTVVFTKVFCLKHFHYKDNHALQKKETFSIFNKAFKSDFSILLKNHLRAWEKLWRRADIIIEGTANIQQNMRFNIYHMLICLRYDNGFSSIGARTLSGEGYRGHIFWDAEIYLLPFYLFTFPRVAKNMLLYRWRRLDEARKIARQNGYKGVQFAWESADSGEEETPEWARDIDRTIIKIYTHKMEYHITADIAYALYKYYIVTRDDKFMEDCGYEMFMEIARFWASRLEYNKRNGKYEINHVIGPDEFHVNVNNNAFTNMMAKWTLVTAVRMFGKIKKKASLYKNLKKKLDLKDKEVNQWKRMASKITMNVNKKKIIEQHDGYFRLKKAVLNRTDENGIPLLPLKLKAKELAATQIVKQADVLMLLNLLDDVFSRETKLANYNFYFPKTVHKSSLSAPMHALSACEAGDLHRAYNLFNVSLRTDISNLYQNTSDGIHAASLGGTWQALVFGFAGIKIKKEKLAINPRMPHTWRKLIFSLNWGESLIKLELTNDVIKVKAVSARQRETEILIFNKPVSIKANRIYTFRRRIQERREEYY